MKRERYLRRRMHTLGMLGEAIAAMRSLSAHHFQRCRQSLPAARDYREEIENALAEVGGAQAMNFHAPPGILLVVSDLGLCGDYNTRLVQTAVEEYHQQAEARLYCLGHRPQAALARYDIAPQHTYQAPTSIDGLPRLLLQLAQDMLDNFISEKIGSLFVVSARFDGVGRFSPQVTCVLPIRAARPAEPLRPNKYQSPRRLVAVAVREFLYTTLYELLLDSLATEHGMRLLAAESARQWIDETAETTRRQLSACRREAATQEVLDIVAGARVRRI